MSSKQTRDEKKALIAACPEDAVRIKVKDEYDKERYREIDSLRDTDIIVVDKSGLPITMKGKPGRRFSPREAPIANEAVANSIRRKDASRDNDIILAVTKENPESPDVLRGVMSELAEEAASLRFEREEAERNGQDTSNLSVRRARVLQAVGDTWLKRKAQLSSDSMDLDSPEFEAVFGFMIETFKKAMLDCNSRPEMIETIIAKFASMLDEEWKSEAKKRVREA
tara:strand:- start:4395 stop:5069 length:675 start_codon:yes stop_codon:yes gene_type:complete